MKRFIVLTLILDILIACAQLPAQSLTVTPSNTQSTKVILPTLVLSPVSTSMFTPMPTASVTSSPFIGQVSIEHALIIYYEITGSTASELRTSMDKSRPKDPYDNNKPVDSYTDWYISWDWPGYETDNCNLSAAVVTYRIKVSMPRWKAPGDASPELITKWEKYTQSLALHERGHVDNIVNNYLSVKTAIQNATCSTAEAQAQKALVLLRKFDSSYDSETKHGQTQGAVFP